MEEAPIAKPETLVITKEKSGEVPRPPYRKNNNERPKIPSPTTFIPITTPPLKATLSALLKLVRAASVVL